MIAPTTPSGTKLLLTKLNILNLDISLQPVASGWLHPHAALLHICTTVITPSQDVLDLPLNINSYPSTLIRDQLPAHLSLYFSQHTF